MIHTSSSVILQKKRVAAYNRSARISALAAIAATLSNCAPASKAPEEVAFTMQEIGPVIQTLSAICLDTLPNFKGHEEALARRGFRLREAEDGNKIYFSETPKQHIVAFADQSPANACGVAFLGPNDLSAVGQAFLQEAQRKTGGPAKERFPTSVFEYAVYLRNNSVMTQDVRSDGGFTRHIILISEPVKRADVSALIYD